MANFEYVHIEKEKDKDLPNALLDAIFAKGFVSCAGVAIPGVVDEEGEEIPYLGTFLQSEGTNTAAVQELLSGHKARRAVLSFGKFPKEFSEDIVQPYVALFDDEGRTTMSVFLSGKGFAAKAKAGADGSPEYQVYNRLILPQILKAAKLHEDDAEKTFKDMAEDPAIAELMKMFYKDEGMITLCCNAGVISWGDAARHEFDGGWATDLCGFEPGKPAASKKNPLSLKSTPKQPEGLKAPAPTASAPVSLPGATDAPAAAADDDEFEWACPPSSWTKDQKGRWYLEHNRWIDGKELPAGQGIKPEGYKNCPKVKVKKKTIVDQTKTGTVKSFSEIPKEIISSNTKVTAEVLPVIPPKDKEYIATIIKRGHVQRTISEGKVILDPKRAVATEEEWPAFIEAGGIEDLRITLAFTDEDRADMIKNAPLAAAVAWKDLSYAYYMLLKDLGRLDFKVAADTKAATEKHITASQTLAPSANKKFAMGGFKK